MAKKSSFALLTIILILGETQARKINLNIKSDVDSEINSELWKKVGCTYSEDYAAYSKSCPKNVRPDERQFRNREGFWSPCGSGKCEIIYYGGSLPQPKSITVTGMTAGNGKILVQGRRSALGQDYDYQVLELNSKNANLTFLPVAADQQANFKESFAFRFVLQSQDMKSIAVLDSIEIDLGDEVLDPEPVTTVAPPLPPTVDFLLETKSDVTGDWTEISCNYMDLAEDLWVWGCPEGLSGTGGHNSPLGYWAPCVSQSCSFVFQAKDKLNHPANISISGILERGGRISLSRKKKGLATKTEVIGSFKLQNSVRNWTFAIPYYYADDLYNVTVTSEKGSTMLIDSLLIHLSSDLDVEPTTATDKTTPKVSDDPGTGSTGIGGSTKPSDPGTGSTGIGGSTKPSDPGTGSTEIGGSTTDSNREDTTKDNGAQIQSAYMMVTIAVPVLVLALRLQ